ncbi:Amylo-alpha-1,6-glucosidase [Anatilimnocola aggregata]|uniref:Amylo-alpha-1,6-glucosidase n=1 Tax=Anatilimnocola aggregata TaxID=2528021 RepID=A0A517YHT5_9BACT|nr:amylo-alpha-1,6-glucosidase [Anatilimnocola aggregata]QDU29772.1 Amylo-alpha-1,6-glucosidase [Anatilimnocola aggregata]
MDNWVLRMPWSGRDEVERESLLTREWLVTNGLGGYASGTVGGVAARRYHSLLIAALPAPLGRRVMLNHLTELVRLPNGEKMLIGGEEREGSLHLHGSDLLTEFRLELGLPVWRYEFAGYVLERRILLPHHQNTVHVNYRLIRGDGTLRIKLRPSIHFRPHEAPVNHPHTGPCPVSCIDGRIELTAPGPLPPLRMLVHGEQVAITLEGTHLPNVIYRVEESRGYEALGELWSPGYFRADLSVDRPVTLVASTESWETIGAITPEQATEYEASRRNQLLKMAHPALQKGPASELTLAADQFLITPAARSEDAARTRAAGDEVRTVIAGYHWFTDWGRDTMISLEGLTLSTGRHTEAGYILRTFGQYVRDGLIPNLFPEGEKQGLYHTADATMWYFHALSRYVTATGDRNTLRLLLPKLLDIVEHHNRGTRFGIGVDPTDGLLRQGEPGYQLTWMDAKVGDWVVTPRRGKPVEINALWYNALRLLENWVREEQGGEAAQSLAAQAERVKGAFNKRFWYEHGNYLYDVVDGEHGSDAALRPNQLFAFSLEHPVLERHRWEAVLNVVREQLLTPVGLRSLSAGHADYKPKYFGDLRARDAAYHQGTVWGWLIGPFIDAWLAVHPEDRIGARRFLEGFVDHLGEACIGSISEVFDAESPFTPRGCIAQAWSVAEVARCWIRTSG